MGSVLGKRKRGGAPLSALQARKARQTVPKPNEARDEERRNIARSTSPDGEPDISVVLESQSHSLESERPPKRYFVHDEPPSHAIQKSAQLLPSDHASSPPAQEVYMPPRLDPRLDDACRSSCKPSINQNVYIENEVVRINLEAEQTVILRGTATLTVESGRVHLGGATLVKGDALPIFAPVTAPLPVVKATTEEAAISLAPLRTGIEGISRLAQAAGISSKAENMWTDRRSHFLSTALGFDIIREPVPQLYASRFPSSWEVAFKDASDSPVEPQITLVSGMPRTGKSTFARMLLNRLTSSGQSVAWLDCDLGQSEFTPPGFVSLHRIARPIIGPSFVCWRSSEESRSHYIGAVDSRSHPDHFLAALADLFEQWHRVWRTSPLIVNLPGWSKGFVADLQIEIQRMVKASCHVHIGTTDDGCPSDPDAGREVYADALGIEAADFLRLNSASKRQLSLLSYFHCIRWPSHDTSIPLWDIGTPLIAKLPYLLPLSEVKEVQAQLPAAPPASEMLHLLNGSLVGLVESPNLETATTLQYEPEAAFIPDSNALALALIRAIDPIAGVLHVLTPVPAEIASLANTLVRGSLELPTVAMLDVDEDEANGVVGSEWHNVPFLEAPFGVRNSRTIGSGARKIRRNIVRKSLVNKSS